MQLRISIFSTGVGPAVHVAMLLWLLAAQETQTQTEEQSCPRTSDPDLSQKLRLEAIKHELLSRLGLDEVPPNPDPGAAPPTEDPTYAENLRAAQEVQRVHNANQKPCTKLDTHKKKFLAFFHSEIKGFPPVRHPTHDQKVVGLDKYSQQPAAGKQGSSIGGGQYNEHYRLKFDITLDNAVSVIDHLRAELRLFKLPRFAAQYMQVIPEDRVEIRLITRPENYLNQELLIFITYAIVPAVDGYAVFDVSKAISEWMSRNNNATAGEMELDVLIRSPEAIRHGPTFEPSVQFSLEERTSQLVMTLYEYERKRRAAIDPVYATENPRKCEFQCCWRPLVVNFKRDYNWTWISHPESIEFNYCRGECPQGWAVDGYHSRLLDIHRQNILEENPTAAPEPCCIPDKYEKQLFVFNNRNNTEFVWVEDAIVKACICR